MTEVSGTRPEAFARFDPSRVPSPCYVIDKAAIEYNLSLLHDVQQRSGARVLAALKAFSCWRLGALNRRYLSGTCASGLHEALLGRDHYGGEVHVFSAAFSEADLTEILTFADHVVFNSVSQWRRFRPLCEAARRARPGIDFGLRINPEHSEGATPIYDPCAPGSRLGIRRQALTRADLDGISGLHFHTLCEQGLPPLARTLAVVEARFADFLPELQWLNLGGGHLISADDYDRDGLVALLQRTRERHGFQLYLEPGEAVAIRTGVLVSTVLDVPDDATGNVILDTSATCHMPDTLEMPYRADILGAGMPGERAHTYRLGGMTCLAGDVIGEYSFDRPLQVGDRLLFEDMSHYTMVKTTTFNGIRLPSIALWDSRSDEIEWVRDFGYADFRDRLA